MSRWNRVDGLLMIRGICIDERLRGRYGVNGRLSVNRRYYWTTSPS